MTRPISRISWQASQLAKLTRPAYTLVEILVATTLALVLLGAVVRMFGDVGAGITDSRAMLESADRLRLAAQRLQQDLAGVTVTMLPPRRPEDNEGYFEYIEGPVGPVSGAQPVAWNTETGAVDTTVGDFDDILMFTTRSTGRPFVGRVPTSVNSTGVISSDVAEVAWFVRGRTLYRRVLLVAPAIGPWAVPAGGFFANYDVSVSVQNRSGSNQLVANTLGDLTKRECRYAHDPSQFPFDVRGWGQARLPTLRECSYSKPSYLWNAGSQVPIAPSAISQMDFWSNNVLADNCLTLLRDTTYNKTTDTKYEPRIADDVILTNVIGFDVKAFDPAVGYVDLGYNPSVATNFSGLGHPLSYLAASANTSRVYDTYSTHYEYTGWPGMTSGTAGQAVNGFDDGGVNGIVDDDGEKLTSPPYPVPLRGIQVKIRVFEPDSRQVREVTVVQDFLPQ